MENEHSLARHSRSEMSTALPRPTERRIAENHAAAPRQISLADIWRTVERRKAPIFGLAMVIFCAVAGYTYLKKPIYEGVARLQIDPSRSTNLGLDDGDKATNVDVDSRVKTEVEIIHSDTVALQVMQSLKLYANPEFAGRDTIGVGVRVTDISQLSPLKQRQLLEKFAGNFTVRVIPNTQVVEIRFRSLDPALAANTANSIIDEYMQRNFRMRVDGTMQVSQWLSGQMEEIRASTTDAQEKLAEFQKQNNLLGTDESDNIVTDRLKQLNEELTQAEADRIIKEGRYRLARSGNPELIASTVPSTTLQTLRTQQADLQAQYAQLNAKYGDGYPKLREVQSQLASVNAAIDAERTNVEMRLANEYDAATKSENMIRDDFEKQKADAYKLNENVAQYSILKHQVESGQQLYDTLQLKLKEASVASGLTSSYVSVVDRAEVPTRPVEPQKSRNLALGLGGGFLAGLLLGMVLDSFDDTTQTSEELEAITALPELASVPFLGMLNGKNRRGLVASKVQGLLPEFRPIPLREPDSQGAEAYRALGSVIMLSSSDNPPKIVVVTSAMAGEGKSTVSCNVATILAQRGLHVLLVDADLRCSSIQSQLGKMPGLSTILVNGPSPYLRYQPLADVPNLHVVPAGFRASAPAEILASAQMQRLLEIWSEEYDHIIIDTPPLLPFADALVLSALADGVILVARSGFSRNKALVRARDVLSRSGVNILGFVLNAVRRPEYYHAYPAEYRSPGGSSYTKATSNKQKVKGAEAF